MNRVWNYKWSPSLLAALFLMVTLCKLWHVQEAISAPQGALETPAQGSFQSGIGVIRGWVCTATQVEIAFDERGSLPAVYGERREDTRPSCGDSNNGFSLQFNWNDLGEGSHTVRAL